MFWEMEFLDCVCTIIVIFRGTNMSGNFRLGFYFDYDGRE